MSTGKSPIDIQGLLYRHSAASLPSLLLPSDLLFTHFFLVLVVAVLIGGKFYVFSTFLDKI